MKFTLLNGEIFMYFRYVKYKKCVEKKSAVYSFKSHGWQRREKGYALQSKKLFYKIQNLKLELLVY